MLERAQRIMQLRGFDDYSEFLSTLIREEWDRRHGPVVFNETHSAESPPTHSSGPVTYHKALKKDTHGKIPNIVKKGVEREHSRSAQSQPKPDA